jgi:hypothetical protein
LTCNGSSYRRSLSQHTGGKDDAALIKSPISNNMSTSEYSILCMPRQSISTIFANARHTAAARYRLNVAFTRTSAVGLFAPKLASRARIDSKRISRTLEQARESHDMRRGRDEITRRL